MFSSLLQDIGRFQGESIGMPPLALTIIFVVYVSWRLWTFTIRPALHPSEPKQVPYPIPCEYSQLPSSGRTAKDELRVLGHAVMFFRDSDKAVTQARLLMGNTREPMGLVIAGQQFYIITSPQDVTAVYNNKKTLTFDEYIQDMMRSMGTSEDGLEKLWKVQSHLHKNLAHAGEDYYRMQFLPGAQFEAFWPQSLQRIDQVLSNEELFMGKPEVQEQSLQDLCRKTLLGPVLTSIFGDAILDTDPQLIDTMVAFDDVSWKINYKIPLPFSRDVHRAKNSLIASFEKYLKYPAEKRSDASWLVKTLGAEMRRAGINVRDMAANNVSVAWTALSNSYKLCFWVLAFLLFDPAALQLVQQEARSASAQRLWESEAVLESTYPRLIAFFNEVLRLTTSSASVRTAASPTQVGRFVLRPGSRVLLPFRQLHMNEQAFGSDAVQFRAWRFFDNDLAKSPSFRPFGGGITYCPGRYLARREVVAVIVIVLRRYDVKLASDQARFPKIDEKKPSLGVLAPLDGEDLLLMMRRAD